MVGKRLLKLAQQLGCCISISREGHERHSPELTVKLHAQLHQCDPWSVDINHNSNTAKNWHCPLSQNITMTESSSSFALVVSILYYVDSKTKTQSLLMGVNIYQIQGIVVYQ